MDFEVEICVKYLGSVEELLLDVENKGFVLQEEFQLNDIYMIEDDVDISKHSNLDILARGVIVREAVGVHKLLLYKYKEFDENGDIIKQGKVKCPILDIQKGKEFLEYLGYKVMFRINYKNYIYTNGKNEIYIQDAGNNEIYIEMEQGNLKLANLNGKDIKEMKEVLNSYNFNIDKSNYFVKKAEIALTKLKTERKRN